MNIRIEPVEHTGPFAHRAFLIMVNGWGTGAEYVTYDGACAVANAIARHAYNPDGVTVIDYSACEGVTR